MLETLYDKIIVKRIDETETTEGGLFIPESSREKSSEGTVVAVGHGTPDNAGGWHELYVNVGDKVVFHKHAGTEIKDGNETYLVMKENEVLAVRIEDQ